MVHRTYLGLGPPDRAVPTFEALEPYVVELLGLQRECAPLSPDHMAIGIALEGLQTTAYHFTRRRHFYHAVTEGYSVPPAGNGRLRDRREAIAAFKALTPYAAQLRQMLLRCRPYGRDYLALMIAKESLETAAFHFTQVASFYGGYGDGAGPTRETV